jgi:biofilm PGA synthesis N-glycosyltransferase PgaC
VESIQLEDELSPESATTIECSIGVMAHNEEAIIGRCLESLRNQRTFNCRICEIVVIASGCTDGTEEVVRRHASEDRRIRLIVQPKREGKASAVNLFLRHATCDVLVSVGADTVLDSLTIQRLVEPFADPDVGMTGGHPVPVNSPDTLMGFAVNVLWELHHQVALASPKMGELIAYRRVFRRIPFNSAVDEAFMEPLVRFQGYKLRYVPEATLRNRGPETVRDFLKQRRRIHAGHYRLAREQGYVVSTMSVGGVLWALARSMRWDWRYLTWLPAVIALEAYARYLGWRDSTNPRRDHAVWEIVSTTKRTIA